MQNLISRAIEIMIKTERLHKHLIDTNASTIGMHRTQHIILMHIDRNKRIESQKSLAERMGITPAAITGALQKLEASGYIKRIVGCDNRYNEIEITEEGRAIVEKTKHLFDLSDRELFNGFTPEELEGYICYINKIYKNIEKQLESFCPGGEL